MFKVISYLLLFILRDTVCDIHLLKLIQNGEVFLPILQYHPLAVYLVIELFHTGLFTS